MEIKANLPETAQYIVYMVFSLFLELTRFGFSPLQSMNWLCRIFNKDPVINWDFLLVVFDQMLTPSSHTRH